MVTNVALQQTKELINQATSISGHTVGNGGRSGLVDDAEDLKAGNGTSNLGGVALRVIEVRRDSDDGLGDLLAEVGLSCVLHLAKDHGRDLLGLEDALLALELGLDDGLLVLLDDLSNTMQA